MKKIIIGLAIATFFFGFNLARAEVVINEVAWMGTETSQYEEWIELKNTGSESVSLVGWKLYKSGGILLFSLSKTIPANGYFLVCRITPSVANPLLGICDEQGTFGGSGLNNTNDLVQLKNASDIEIDLINGVSGWPAGNAVTKETMQKSGSNWITAVATPKAQNPTSASTSSTPVGTGALVSSNPDSDTSSSPTITTETKSKVVEIPKIKTQISAKNISFVGLPIILDASTTGYSGEQLYFGKYFWNFGDGDSKEVGLADSQKFTHTYFYPGDYVVSLDYYQNSYSNVPDASSQITIKIIPADIFISRVGDEKDFFVELTNNTSYDADISNWFLVSDQKSFTIPRNTVLTPKKTIIISPQITHFSIADKDSLKLLTSQGEIAFDYTASVVPIIARTVLAKTQTSSPTPSPSLRDGEGKAGGEVNLPRTTLDISSENLQASAFSASENNTGDSNSFSKTIIPIVSIIFIGASAGAVYFIRQKKIIPTAGNDFEILDE